jgi:hypothetical protein
MMFMLNIASGDPSEHWSGRVLRIGFGATGLSPVYATSTTSCS